MWEDIFIKVTNYLTYDLNMIIKRVFKIYFGFTLLFFPSFLILDLFLIIYALKAINFSLNTDLSASPHISIYCFYIIFSSNYLLISLSISSLIHVLFKCVLFNFQISGVSLDLLLLNVNDFHFNPFVVRERTLGFQPFSLIGSSDSPAYGLCERDM